MISARLSIKYAMQFPINLANGEPLSVSAFLDTNCKQFTLKGQSLGVAGTIKCRNSQSWGLSIVARTWWNVKWADS